MRPPEYRKKRRRGPEARKRRAVLRLRAEGLSPREIAGALGASEETVLRVLKGAGVVAV